METGTTFNSKNQTWKINHILPNSEMIRTTYGWTHTASVSRPKGTKTYYAHLVVEDGKILHSSVIV